MCYVVNPHSLPLKEAKFTPNSLSRTNFFKIHIYIKRCFTLGRQFGIMNFQLKLNGLSSKCGATCHLTSLSVLKNTMNVFNIPFDKEQS